MESDGKMMISAKEIVSPNSNFDLFCYWDDVFNVQHLMNNNKNTGKTPYKKQEKHPKKYRKNTL